MWRVTAVGTNLEGIPHSHIVDVSDQTIAAYQRLLGEP
jgi:hypothetical protein